MDNKLDERSQIYSSNDVNNLIVMAIEKCARKCSEYEDYHWKLYQANPNSLKAWDHQTRANAAANCESAILALRSEFLPELSASPSATKGTGVTPALDNAKPPAVQPFESACYRRKFRSSAMGAPSRNA